MIEIPNDFSADRPEDGAMTVERLAIETSIMQRYNERAHRSKHRSTAGLDFLGDPRPVAQLLVDDGWKLLQRSCGDPSS